MEKKRHSRASSVDCRNEDLMSTAPQSLNRYGSEDHRQALKSLSKQVVGMNNSMSQYGMLRKDKSVPHFNETWSRRGFKAFNLKALASSESKQSIFIVKSKR